MKQLNIIAAVGIVINVTVNLLLIPRMQACGSAIASFCTQFAVAIMQFIIALRIVKFPFSSLPWLRCLLFTALLVPVTILAPRFLHFGMLWSLLILGVFSLLLGFATGLLRFNFVKTMFASSND